MKNNRDNKRKLDYKWIMAGLCFLMVFTCLGFGSSPKLLFLDTITSAQNIARSQYAFTDSLRFASTAIVNIFFGALINKFGAKKLIGAGFISLILSMLVSSVSSNVFGFYIGGILLGVGLSWTTTTMVGYVINKWCSKNRASIMGAILAANGVGGALAVQVVSPIIESSTFGYKNAYFIVALILFAVGSLIMIFFKNEPKDPKPIEAVSTKKKSRGQIWPGIEYSAAIKKAYFYGAIICIFLTGLALQGLYGVAKAHMRDIGLEAEYVAAVISLLSLSLATFKFFTGIFYDKFGLRATITVCSITAVCVSFILAFLTSSPTGRVLAVIYGIFVGLALPLETILVPIYASDLFGEKSFNKILGIFVSFNSMGYALSSPIMNFCHDTLGSYQIPLIACGCIMIVVVIMLQFIINAANRVKKEVADAEKQSNTESLETPAK